MRFCTGTAVLTVWLILGCGGSSSPTGEMHGTADSSSFEQMSADQHLAEARRLTSASATVDDLDLAARHVEEVLKRDPNSKEAQTLNAQAMARLSALRDQSRASDSVSGGAAGITAADRFAMTLERTYKNNGYDIDAVVDIDKALVLTSDVFKDASTREAAAAELWKDRKTLCSLDIWYVKVGYNNGIFSSDVAKNVSLGCPAQKAAYTAQMAPEREKAAATLSVEGVQASVRGTTLVFESDLFSEATFRSRFVEDVEGNPDVKRANCRLAFTQVQLTYKGKVMKTVPVSCE